MTSASLRCSLVVLVFGVSCSSKSESEQAAPPATASPTKPADKPPRAAPTVDVSYNGSLSFRYTEPSQLGTDHERYSEKEGRLSMSVVRDQLEIAFQDLPVGTSVRAGERTKVVVPEAKDANGKATEIHDIGRLVTDGADLLARARNSAWSARYRLSDFATKIDESITIEMPRYQPIVVKYNQEIGVRDVKGILRRVVDGPVRFADESDAQVASKSAGILIDVLGESSTQSNDFLTKFGIALTDIRFVALVTQTEPQSAIKCGGYQKPVAGTAVMEGNYKIEIQLLSQSYAIYDRLDGKKVAEKTFRASGACPDTSMTTGDGNSGISLVPDRALVARWVTSEAAKRR